MNPDTLAGIAAMQRSMGDGIRLNGPMRRLEQLRSNRGNQFGVPQPAARLRLRRAPDNATYEELLALDESHYNIGNGLSEEELSLLHITVLDEDWDPEEKDPICQDRFLKGNSVIRLPCSHDFHADCILEWLKRSSRCPIDNQDIRDLL